jgi:hypothetical protein
MTKRSPPRLASWILMHIASAYRRDSFIGDLSEQFECGKSRAWYWKQVFATFLVTGVTLLRTTLTTVLALLCLVASVCLSASTRITPFSRIKAIRRLLAALAAIAVGTATLTWAGTSPSGATHPPAAPVSTERR